MRENPLHRGGIYTDLYELTMAQGYFLSGKTSERASFDYFFRKNPFGGSYVVFAGLQDLMDVLGDFGFRDEDVDYLKTLGFQDTFLDYLKDFEFKATISGMREGEIVFPLEPILKVQGGLIETQIIETLVLNILNFQSLIATKAARIKQAADGRSVVDFGLRRAQGLGGVFASKAAVIGGLAATSNVFAGYKYGLDVAGTQAHSWIQCFDDELTAFRKFAEYFPDRCILLIDTYDSLKGGLPNVITVAHEMEERGQRLVGIRIDSGDLAYLSKHARTTLDEAGLDYVKIFASNQLDEHLINSLIDQGAPIDAFGVGTNLVTGQDSPALDGVYKLAVHEGAPCLKISENYTKTTLPGAKRVDRYFDDDGMFYADAVSLETEDTPEKICHPFYPGEQSDVAMYRSESLHHVVMEAGRVVGTLTDARESAAYARERLALLPEEHKRFVNPHIFKVGISKKLMDLRTNILQDLKKHYKKG